jgi:glucose/arabinose dehydrogenase
MSVRSPAALVLLSALLPLVAGEAPKLVPVFGERTFERPLGLYQPVDGRHIYVLQQRGTVLVFAPGGNADGAVFLQRQVLHKGNEEGLLSVAFHPKFADNGTFFLYYCAADPRRTVVSRMRTVAGDASKADLASEEVLLTADQPFENHNGGTLLFGSDGKLYLGLGDGGAAGDPHDNGQKTGTLLGKVIRIDVDQADAGLKYAVPKDNPFVGQDGWKPEIWALGLRNPWRMSFDRGTGDLWAGDVGQNYWEEIDLITRGGNYGWKNHEGKVPFEKRPAIPGAIDPVFVYNRGEGQSVTGGYVYRGKRLKELVGCYVYGDFNTGRIWALRRQGERVENRLLIQLPKGQQVASFAEDAAGELYLCTFEGANGNQGRVYRFEP